VTHPRITEIKTFLIGGSERWCNWLIVKVETDCGIHGVGEATLEGKSKTVESAVKELARYLVGKDAFAIEKHFQEMYRRSYYAGGAVLTSAISGVEMALWDIKGKALGVPVYELLGGRTRDRVLLYANAWYQQGMSPEEFQDAARAVTALGVKGLKFNPWGRRPGIDFYRLENEVLNAGVDAVAAVREAVGPDIAIYIDCNGIFNTTGNAIRAAKAIERYNISFFEEPVPHENLEAMAYVRRKIDIPVATGERLFTIFSFQQLLECGGADIVQPDLAHCGGILEARKIAAIADAHYAAVAPHNPNGEVSYAAAVQLAACVPNFLVLEHFPPEPWRFELCSNPMTVEDGWLEIPDRPGLGVEFNEEAVADHPYVPLDLYDLHRPEGSLKEKNAGSEFKDRLR
jgi:galactonate dehydratase